MAELKGSRKSKTVTMFQLSNDMLVKTSSYASVCLGALVLLTKFYGFYITSSNAVLASATDAAFDFSASIINLLVVMVALTPPDHRHRFGHQKFQDLAVFFQSTFFIFSSIVIIYNSLSGIINQSMANDLKEQNTGIAFMYISMGLTFVLVIYQNYVFKKTKSGLVAMDKMHYISHILENFGVIISLYLSRTFPWIDSICSIILVIYIISSCRDIMIKSMKNLVDEEMPDSEKEKIVEIIKRNKKIMGMHDLKTRYAANKIFIQFHVEVDPLMTIKEAHDITDDISSEILLIFENAEIIIHHDPSGIKEVVEYREYFIN